MTNGINWLLLAGFLFCLASWVGNWSQNNSLHDQLAHKEEVIEKKDEQISKMHSEHAMAMNAANEALKLRKEIAEAERRRMCNAEKALGKHSEYCNSPVPDDVRLLWQDTPDDTASDGITGRH